MPMLNEQSQETTDTVAGPDLPLVYIQCPLFISPRKLKDEVTTAPTDDKLIRK